MGLTPQGIEYLHKLGEKKSFSTLAEYTGQIRLALKLLSEIESIRMKLDSINNSVKEMTEDYIISAKRRRKMVSDYQRDKRDSEAVIYGLRDTISVFLAGISEDKHFVETLKESAGDLGIDQDFGEAVDQVKSIFSLAGAIKENLQGEVS